MHAAGCAKELLHVRISGLAEIGIVNPDGMKWIGCRQADDLRMQRWVTPLNGRPLACRRNTRRAVLAGAFFVPA